jgi:hypothetical protein
MIAVMIVATRSVIAVVVTITATHFLGLAGRHVAIAPALLFSVLPSRGRAARIAVVIAISITIMVSIAIMVAIVVALFRLVMVAIFVIIAIMVAVMVAEATKAAATVAMAVPRREGGRRREG